MIITEKHLKVKRKKYKMGYDSTNPAYKFKVRDIYEEVTRADLDQLERFADKLFSKVGIDVEFTRHFLDRVNDERNSRQITSGELTRLFKQEFKKWGKPIAQMGPDQEAVMKDLQTDINMPFALVWDKQNNELDLVAKTVMRKKDFKTSNKEFPVEQAVENTIKTIMQETGLTVTEIADIISKENPKESIKRLIDSTNFYKLNVLEAPGGDVRSIDPQIVKMFNKARAKFPQAKTDMEAFIKFMQDDYTKDNRAFNNIAKRISDQEKKIVDLEKRLRKVDNKKLYNSKSTSILHKIAEVGVGKITKQNATKDVPVGGEYMNIKKVFPGQTMPVPLTGKAKKKDK